MSAAVGVGVAGIGASIWSAKKSADAVSDAASSSNATNLAIYNQQREDFQPFYDVGVSALPGLKSQAESPLPSYDEMVYQPMQGWDYEQSPAYKAKYSLGMEELNKQLQARGLASSGVGASRASDLSRKLTSEDYGNERQYQMGQYTRRYTGAMAENTDRYNRLLDQVRIGQGAAGSLGQAGNAYAGRANEATMAAGNAESGFYSGLGGVIPSAVGTGLRTYDYGNKAGWWGNNQSQVPVNASGYDGGLATMAEW